jgi:hypothetical protein
MDISANESYMITRMSYRITLQFCSITNLFFHVGEKTKLILIFLSIV